ncbi:L-threonylcarbamoyladenylate synthase [Erysipelothrix urinaevulpis]|uniref:L-threonylcarbamoyladenylate synthase n=1 Tax=Erysipelothrix urinaevulpis TaxID=2683717 RepID=UPI00135C39C0|nr:L-threonylcarbamoyladenylate synthase [Erysipelothrix urinaevulpis]
METIKFSKDEKDAIVSTIKSGGLVAIMTDTVYGLAADSSQDELYEKLQKAKGRPADKPFPLMVSSYQQIEDIAVIGERERRLIHAFMPGACTFIFKIKEGVFPFLSKQSTIGIRMADDQWVLDLIEGIGSPIWLPSANLSGLETALNSDMVIDQLDGKIEGVVLGKASGRQSSSVFDLSGESIVCLREGPLSLEEVLKEESR